MIKTREKIIHNGNGFIPLLLTLLLPVLLASCGSNLSREKAKKIILEHFKYPLAATLEINLDEPCYFMGWYPGSYNIFSAHKSCDGITDNKNWSTELENKGFMTLTPYEGSDGARGIVASLTKEGSKYAMDAGRIKMADKEFLEVTGIRFSGDNKGAIVEYTWKYSNQTPFAKGTEFDDTNPKNADVRLALYDDGWRVFE